MIGFEAWENSLFDKYNGEGHSTDTQQIADELFYGEIEKRRNKEEENNG